MRKENCLNHRLNCLNHGFKWIKGFHGQKICVICVIK